jgi:DNA-binding LacI/PurR family transcriptional regulator
MGIVKPARVTIRDVAREAGVSLQTVSRVVNQHPDVADSTRAGVESVIKRLRYFPNGIARSLVGAPSRTLGVVTAGFEFFGPSQMLVGIERQATEQGYQLSLNVVRERDIRNYERIVGNLLSQQVDGVIWVYPELTGADEHAFHSQIAPHMPVVFLSMAPQPDQAVINIDNRSGARLVTEHLIARGYRSIGVITGAPGLWSTNQRVLGWRDALLGAGLPATEAQIVAGDWTARGGEAGLTALRTQFSQLDAVFASNDQTALGALRAAHAAGLRIPQDLGVAGFDDIPEASYFSPPLTTVRNNLSELGRIAVRELQRVIDARRDGQDALPNSLVVTPQLVVRDSA